MEKNSTLFFTHIPKCGGNGLREIFKNLGYETNNLCDNHCGHKDNTKEILIGVDLQTKHIYNLIKMEKDGTKITFTINSFKTNQPLSKNHFTFTESKYPNYYINRLD